MHPEWIENASLYQLRGDAFIGLAKKCSIAAKQRGVPQAARQRSWALFDDYVQKADAQLTRALELSSDPDFLRVVQRNRSFLESLKASRQRSHNN